MSVTRPRTPSPSRGHGSTAPPVPLTPEQVRRIETNRLKAKAIRNQKEAALRTTGDDSSARTSSRGTVSGHKRPYASLSAANTPATSRDARNESQGPGGAIGRNNLQDRIEPTHRFSKVAEYDFSKMTDTKGGFLTAEDDPHNKALHALAEGKPAEMTMQEWERQRDQRSQREARSSLFEPGLSVLKREEHPECRECGSMEIDWKWHEVFGCRVCSRCKEKYPDRYSLLTKTEAREDYLLTDPELKDPELLPHLDRPNPHKSTWNNMMLYLRYQVEEYAFSPRKWGSAEALDEQFSKREADKKKRKEEKFRSRLRDLKKRTRVEAHRRNRTNGAARGEFGDDLGRGGGKHEHEWGQTVTDPDTGIGVKTCVECGMEVEELEF
ncbi:MAG: hypothetical protein M1825_005573 [Sarcosagium campestre]|nr:MAG: hypothetical protein M1825_005573 [Sarcosagium campestre]